jgi:ketosteroid isomerase-like protein
MKRLILLLPMIIAALSLPAMAQNKAGSAKPKTSKAEEELMKLERDGVEASKRGDVAFFEKLEAPDYLFTDPSGMVHTRDEDLAIAKSGDLKFESMDIDEMKVRLYGDTAVITGVTTVKGTFKNQDISGKYRWTDVYVKRGGQWQIVNAQLTPIQSQPAKQ